jgi:hypothetical protein
MENREFWKDLRYIPVVRQLNDDKGKDSVDAQLNYLCTECDADDAAGHSPDPMGEAFKPSRMTKRRAGCHPQKRDANSAITARITAPVTIL